MSTTTASATAVAADTEMSDREQDRFSRWAGHLGLVAAAAYLTTVVATSLLGSVEAYETPDDIVRYLDEVADTAYRPLLYGIAGIVMSVLFVPLAVAGYRALRRTALAGLGAIALAIGLVSLIPAYVMNIVEGTVLASAASDLGGGSGEALYVTTEFASGVATVSFTVGSSLTLGVTPLLWAIEGRRTGTFSGWVNWAGLITGVTGLVWFVWFFESAVTLPVLLVNVVASLVYFVGISLAVRSPRSAELRTT